MGNREEIDHLTAQWRECPVTVAAQANEQVFAAFAQALAELGVPVHPGGQCPPGDCACTALIEVVTFRAYEILGLPPEAVLEDF